MKKFKIALIASFILLLTIVIDTHFAPLKDLSKAFACMTNFILIRKTITRRKERQRAYSSRDYE